MGLLTLFSKHHDGALPLPSGTFTVDRDGKLLSSTVSSSYPREMALEIGAAALRVFQEAQEAQLALKEIVFNFRSFKIKARELRGGAMVFLSPREERIGSRKP